MIDLHRKRDIPAELVDHAGARSIEPEIADSVHAAAWFPDEAQVDPPQLLRALVVATVNAGVVIRQGTTVSALRHDAGRCVGVTLEGDTAIDADAIVLAAGSWSSLVPGLSENLPRVRPVRGQLVMLEQRPPQVRAILYWNHSYVVPRGDGRVICGSTMEDVGHRREVTAAGIEAILSAALRICPRLGSAELVKTWCNFRPCSASGTPLVGDSPIPGLYLATGHHRNGILLAQETGNAVANAILSRV
jgi:glycine oxidase